MRENRIVMAFIRNISDDTAVNVLIARLPISDELKVTVANMLLSTAKSMDMTIAELLLSEDFKDLLNTMSNMELDAAKGINLGVYNEEIS